MIPTRIGYVLHIFPKLSETFIANELVELKRRGVSFRILSLLPPREEMRHQFITEMGLDRLTCYEPKRFPEVLRDFRPQLLHAHFATEATAAARELSRKQGIPFTFTSHGYDIYRKAPADFTERAAAAAAVVTVSQANAAYLREAFQIPESKIRVCSCGVDTARFCPAEVQTNGSLPVILCVARLVAVKNLQLLMEACSRLQNREVKFRCVLVGDGPCRAELEGLRRDLGLEEILEMPGAAEHEQVRALWQQATVGVLSSRSEGMPVSLMEAAACGVPVVATAVGGVPELIRDGVTGVLVPPDDPEAMSLALEKVIKNSGFRKELATSARERARNEFSLERQVNSLLDLWSEILEKTNSV
jgi:glycosyltransferase involved in cell wall biosynthesis